MDNNFLLNRYDFTNLIKDLQKMNTLPQMLVDPETGIEFYRVNAVPRNFLIRVLTEFNLMDNLEQIDSKREYEKQVQQEVKHYQFEPSWVELGFDKVTVGYVGIYVNTDFSLIFAKDDANWNLVGK